MSATINDVVILSSQQATAMLPDKEFVHVYVQQPPDTRIFGCEWPIADVLAEIEAGECSLAGPEAARMNHSLGIASEAYGNMFVETNPQ